MLVTKRNMMALCRVYLHSLSRASILLARHNLTSAPAESNAISPQFRLHTPRPKPALESHTPLSSQKILISQRLARPVAPHLKIYKWQITSVLSSLERITGVMLSGTFYLFSLTYLASLSPNITSLLPFSLDLSSASLAAAFGAWPWAVKVATKFVVSLPFTLHAFNGIRYLVWDLGLQMAKRQVVRTGFVVTALAIGSAGWLAVM